MLLVHQLHMFRDQVWQQGAWQVRRPKMQWWQKQTLGGVVVVGSLPRRAVVSRIEASVVGRLIDRDPGRTRYSSL